MAALARSAVLVDGLLGRQGLHICRALGVSRANAAVNLPVGLDGVLSPGSSSPDIPGYSTMMLNSSSTAQYVHGSGSVVSKLNPLAHAARTGIMYFRIGYHGKSSKSTGGSGKSYHSAGNSGGDPRKFWEKLFAFLKKVKPTLTWSEVYAVVVIAAAVWSLEITWYQGMQIIRIVLTDKRNAIHSKLEAYQRAVLKSPDDDDIAEATVNFSVIDLLSKEVFHKIFLITKLDLAILLKMIEEMSMNQPDFPGTEKSTPTTSQGLQLPLNAKDKRVIRPTTPSSSYQPTPPTRYRQPTAPFSKLNIGRDIGQNVEQAPPYVGKPYLSYPYPKTSKKSPGKEQHAP